MSDSVVFIFCTRNFLSDAWWKKKPDFGVSLLAPVSGTSFDAP